MPRHTHTQESPRAPTNATIGQVITVNTKNPSPESERRVRADDVRSLKQKDSFLYYSIPSVRTAEMLGREIDTSALATASNDTSSRESDPTQDQSFTVTRRKQISFECHPCKFVDEFLGEDTGDLEEVANDDFFDLFFGSST